MKKLLLSLFALMVTGSQVNAQVVVSKTHPIQIGKWYVTGAVDGKSMSLGRQKGASDWEAQFNTNGSLRNCSTLKTAVVDPTGVEVKPGTFYCDSMYTYQIKNNMINISYLNSSYYYKISANGNDAYKLTPAIASDFK